MVCAAVAVLAVGGIVSGCAAGGQTSAQSGSNGAEAKQPQDAQGTDPGNAGKVLVAYYSAQNHTKHVAETVADELGADIFEIVPEQVYSDSDLDWTDPNSRVSQEHDDESLRDVPLAQTTPDGWEGYDTVIIGYPIWWGIAAWPCDRFVSDNDFTGKKVIPFCTSSSSGIGQSAQLLADAAGTGDWQEGQRFSSGVSDSEVRSWAAGI